jgi:hypothetical protein
MYNLWTRLNAVFFYGATALFLAASASNITCVVPNAATAGSVLLASRRACATRPWAVRLTHAPCRRTAPLPSRCSTRWFTPQAVVTRLALTDVKALKPMREPMLLRAQTNDRAVFTFDLEAGAW